MCVLWYENEIYFIQMLNIFGASAFVVQIFMFLNILVAPLSYVYTLIWKW